MPDGISLILAIVLGTEFLLRVIVELREIRSGRPVGWRVLLRCVPVLNDFYPEEGRLRGNTESGNNGFVKAHERGHRVLHHYAKRSAIKGMLLFWTICGMVYVLNDWHVTLIQALLILHVIFAIFRIPFHYLCWMQEYDADRWALRNTSKTSAEKSLKRLAVQEPPHTPVFALLYWEHPTAFLRLEKLFSNGNNK